MDNTQTIFRAWDKKRKEMRYQEDIKISFPPDIDCHLTELKCFFDSFNDREYKDGHRVTNGIEDDRYILMLCAGLLDKKLQRIFVDDIVKLYTGEIGVVTLPTGQGFQINYYDKKAKTGWSKNLHDQIHFNGPSISTSNDGKVVGEDWYTKRKAEVIGNIHENPEYGLS